jgi:hypothetical protein
MHCKSAATHIGHTYLIPAITLQCLLGHAYDGNSIAFGSAPQREADSQPISQLAKPAVSQTETHSLGSLSVADAAPSSGENIWLQASSGRMVMQLTADIFVGGLNLGQVNMAVVLPMTVEGPGFEPPT